MKVFIVGCSRSGTSILQREISKYFGLYSPVETGFFLKNSINIKQRLINLIKLDRALNNLDVDLQTLFKKIYISLLLIIKKSCSANRYYFLKYLIFGLTPISYFDGEMSSKVKLTKLNGWLEKTPMHFYNISRVLEGEEDIKILFVIRDPIDVIASIRDRSIKFPEQFGEQYDFQYGIKLWNDSIKSCLKHINENYMLIVSYDKFISDFDLTQKRLKRFLNAEKYTGDYSPSIVKDGEFWKEGVNALVKKQKSKRDDVFTEAELRNINKMIDWKTYNQIMEYERVVSI